MWALVLQLLACPGIALLLGDPVPISAPYKYICTYIYIVYIVYIKKIVIYIYTCIYTCIYIYHFHDDPTPGSGGRLVAGCRMVRDGVPEGGGFGIWVFRAGLWARVFGGGVQAFSRVSRSSAVSSKQVVLQVRSLERLLLDITSFANLDLQHQRYQNPDGNGDVRYAPNIP